MARVKMLPELVSLAEVAPALDRTPAALHHWVRAGAFAPVDTSGRAALYRLVDVIVAARDKNVSIENILRRVPAALRDEVEDALEAGDAPAGEVPDLGEERALHERAKRQKAELQLQVMRRELLPAPLVRSVYSGVGAMVREKLLSLDVESQSHLDKTGEEWLSDRVRSLLIEIAKDAERISSPLYEHMDVEQPSAEDDDVDEDDDA